MTRPIRRLCKSLLLSAMTAVAGLQGLAVASPNHSPDEEASIRRAKLAQSTIEDHVLQLPGAFAIGISYCRDSWREDLLGSENARRVPKEEIGVKIFMSDESLKAFARTSLILGTSTIQTEEGPVMLCGEASTQPVPYPVAGGSN